MGTPKSQRKDTNEENYPRPQRKHKKSLESCLDDLDLKSASKREEAFSVIIDCFKKNIQSKFVEKNFLTLLHQCLKSIRKCSSKEISLASYVIGLLSITVGRGGNVANEILEESMHPLLLALKSMKLQSLLECITIVTFVGASGPEDMDKSMCIIWEELLLPESGSSACKASNLSAQLLTAAISAWSFLLAASDKWNISSTHWKKSISYFSNLLKNDDESVRLVAVETLSLICEIGVLEKFSNEQYANVEVLKESILNQMLDLSIKDHASGKDLDSENYLSSEVAKLLKDGYRPQTSVKISGDVQSFSTWSQVTKVNYLKRFLEGGFQNHMLENELLHEFLKFTPKTKQCIDRYDGSKEDIHYFYQPELKKGESVSQRMFKSPNSFLSKAKTQLINKQRAMSEVRKGACDANSFKDEEA